ncbi:MAG: tRNA (adenosine(37)-N6)-threonylcarbamoyltransferase complex transferase subunit TsaD [Gemmatimonadetes bacterium]|nr:tRNA (adenosine(37)-N6)-threonylcarbamoyltransferase complex transferase subunit TsaD [Gemmatimonadota bacterium]
MNGPLVLGVETSCDETSVAVLDGEHRILGHVILSQDVHEVYGGVVPELAARQHLAHLDRVVDRALDDAGVGLDAIDAVAATAGPGLVGALLVGVGWARAAARALGVPFVPVHHMEAHLFAPSLESTEAEPPFVALLVSGGHTLLLYVSEWGRYELLGETRDDAAGEAFDKVAKLLGLPYPGGRPLSDLAQSGDPTAFRLPRPMLRRDQRPGTPAWYDMSFSGLKTAVLLALRELEAEGEFEARRADLAASFEAAVVDVLVSKTLRAVEERGCRRVLMGGGVSANRRLRAEMAVRLGDGGRVIVSSPRLAMDNGAMVARAGRFHLDRGSGARAEPHARPDLPFPGLRRAAD